MAELTAEQARAIGQAAYRQVLAAHTYGHRIEQLEQLLHTTINQKNRALA
jgi:spore maturation protein CgeB